MKPLRALILLLVGAIIGFLAARTTQRPKVPRLPEYEFDRDALHLDAPVTIDAHNQPLEHVLDLIAQQAKANLRTDWDRLKNASITPSTPITIYLDHVPLDHALQALYESDGLHGVLCHFVDGGHLIFSTLDAPKPVVTRLYEINPLIKLLEKRRLSFVPDYDGSFNWKPDTAEDWVMEFVRDSVDTNSWKASGGDTGALRIVDGLLVVTQTKENQENVVNVLNKLFRRYAGPPATQPGPFP